MSLANHIYYTDDAIEHYTRLASGITAITELKNIFDTATSELANLHREYCEKTGTDEPLELPKLPEAGEGQQLIWNKIDPNSSSLGSVSFDICFLKFMLLFLAPQEETRFHFLKGNHRSQYWQVYLRAIVQILSWIKLTRLK